MEFCSARIAAKLLASVTLPVRLALRPAAI